MKMAKNKDSELKQFLVSSRKKIRPGLTNAPVWVLQKAGKDKMKCNWGPSPGGMMAKSGLGGGIAAQLFASRKKRDGH